MPSEAPAGEEPRPSPGMVDRHYAPRARLRLVDAEDGGQLQRALIDVEEAGVRAAVIARVAAPVPGERWRTLPADPA